MSRDDDVEAEGTTAAALAAARPEASVGLDRRVGLAGVLAAVLGGAPRRPTVGRFRLEQKIGGGGMGVVYRAVDSETGQAVAVKLLDPARNHQALAGRLFREARILADLRHPAIVRYIDHGYLPEGGPYLAMEWLDGEDLAQRLRRKGVTADEAVKLGIRLAEALAEAHARGVVHRDLKPANVFLPGGNLEEAKLLDFGIARTGEIAATRLTVTGVLLGTPSYLSPEQVRGTDEIDGRADLFALGCVLHECLTGRPAFVAENLIGLLARILFAAAPRIARSRGDIPDALDELVARLLAKESEGRPREALEVAHELRALGPLTGASAPPTPVALSTSEQLVVTVVVVGQAAVASEERLRAAARRRGVALERVTRDTLLATVARGPAVDQVAAAARLALELAAQVPDTPIALATGRGVAGGVLPLGDAVDRAAEIVAARRIGVWVDEVAAALLDGAFDLSGGRLVGARAAGDAAHTLLGQPTPCVGRERELALLDGELDECRAGPGARAVLVTAPSGAGKSRLAREWVHRLSARAGAPRVLVCRGEPTSAGVPHFVVGQLLRDRIGAREDATAEEQRTALREALAVTVPPEQRARLGTFLGELAGIEPDVINVVSEELRAARGNPLLMGDQLRLAWEDWLHAETAAGPLVLIVEDLHWGDAPSVALLGAALRGLAERPLFVLALGRHEVRDLFPVMWSERMVQRIRLAGLTPRASEELARAVLGPTVDAATVRWIGERAGGHALYLEEVIRAVAMGDRDRVPPSTLAIVEGRLMALPTEARRVLRAASIFGDVFWRGGVAVLTGGEAAATGEILEDLVAREMILRRRTARFPGEIEYSFRHALFREAAEAMLTETDRVLGSRLAADWLLGVGERSPLLLAEHLERGGDRGRAAGFFLAAARDALQGNDFVGAIAYVGRGRHLLDDDGELRGHLHLVRSEAHAWRGDEVEAEQEALVALDHLAPASGPWYAAIRVALTRVPARRVLLDRLVEMLAGPPQADDEARRGLVMASVAAANQLFFHGHGGHAGAWRLVARAEAIAASLPPLDEVHAWIERARASAFEFEGRHDLALDANLAAARRFEALGNLREACSLGTAVGWLQATELGRHDDAVRTLQQSLELATRMGLQRPILAAKQNLGAALLRLDRLDEARALLEETAREFGGAGDARMEAGSRYYLVLLHTRRGDIAGAADEATAALELARDVPTTRACLLAALARALLAASQPVAALSRARAAAELLGELGAIEEGEGLIRLALAEALRATGAVDEARAAIEAARARLRERAARIADPAVRRGFLEEVPEHAATFGAPWSP